MERIFKIKTKTNPDSRFQYPSERRYSASIVLGLSVVFLQLFLYSILMGTLIIHKMALHEQTVNSNETSTALNNTNSENGTEETNTTEEAVKRLHNKVGQDLENENSGEYSINIPALVCAGCFVMALGSAFSFTTGLLAWKRWYIDHNITFFFLSSSFSALTSAICLLLSLLTTLNMDFNLEEYQVNTWSPITFSLAMNIIILSSIGVVWSCLSTNIAYKGMKNYYPDDMVISKGGRTVEVSTVRKGSKNCNPLPPDIINHFPVSGKLAKYLPKQENTNLPKAESNFEYRERVNKFLAAEPDGTENAK